MAHRGGHSDGMGWKPAGPPHPGPLPLGGGEGESSPVIGLPPLPRRGGEGRGEGENGGGDKMRPLLGRDAGGDGYGQVTPAVDLLHDSDKDALASWLMSGPGQWVMRKRPSLDPWIRCAAALRLLRSFRSIHLDRRNQLAVMV